MDFLPKEFFGVDGFAFFVFMTDGNNAGHAEFLGNAEYLPNIFFRGFAIGTETLAHFHPAATQTQVGGLQLHQHSSNARIFHPNIAFGCISGDHNGQRSGEQTGGVSRFALTEFGQYSLVFDDNELPGADAFRRRSHKCGFKNQTHVLRVDGLGCISPDAAAIDEKIVEAIHYILID